MDKDKTESARNQIAQLKARLSSAEELNYSLEQELKKIKRESVETTRMLKEVTDELNKDRKLMKATRIVELIVGLSATATCFMLFLSWILLVF